MTRALVLLAGAWMAIAEASAQGWRTTTETDRMTGKSSRKYTRAYGSQSAPGEKVIVLTCDDNTRVYGVGPTAVWAVRGGREGR